ncbi:carbohydrate kinase family protein [Celeribacter neptunius]|uniref:Sugar or nucleoside kinase, ribokinase family n=1 Tax=Celeribacter neptunius TaxID=588602 RepID=A0A1I3VQ97_9RHOB|nr:carbohydrate kinase family protein [Celeribacter neptunius]SFJ97574.1 Sugar or nucleoside kinase, ribokinase family [Celeribacter neptunius]
MTRRDGEASPPANAAPIAIVGSFSIDSVVTPDGETLPAKPGGNALWSSIGAYLAGQIPRIIARVGTDYPAHVLDRLRTAGFDLDTLIRLPRTHPVRVSYVHRPNGERIQPVPEALLAQMPPHIRAEFVDTTQKPETLVEGAPTPDDIPASWLGEVNHWHLPLLPLARHRALVDTLSRAAGMIHADCPTRQELIAAPFERLQQTLTMIDVFLPSTSDFDVFAPTLDVTQALLALRHHGAGALILKAGADGVYLLEDHSLLHLPAFPAEPIDPTGAGDAFCGGFLVARAAGASMIDAAAMGSASASFALETANPLDLLEVERAEVTARMQAIRSQVKSLPSEFLALEPGTEKIGFDTAHHAKDLHA